MTTLPYVKLGKAVRFRRGEVERHLAMLEVRGCPTLRFSTACLFASRAFGRGEINAEIFGGAGYLAFWIWLRKQ
jgi:hypothetical protein